MQERDVHDLRELAIFGELDTLVGVKANLGAIRRILDQAGRRDYTVKVYPKRIAQPDGGSARQSQQVCPPQTIPTGFLRNNGRLNDNTTSSACTSKALGQCVLLGLPQKLNLRRISCVSGIVFMGLKKPIH